MSLVVARSSSEYLPYGRVVDDLANRMTLDLHVKTASLDMTWDTTTRVCVARVTPGANLTGEDGADLVGAVDRWVGEHPTKFAVLADGGGGHQTDRAYRAALSRYFRRHIDVAYVAFFGLTAELQVVVEMLRVGSGMNLIVLPHEDDARAWLRERGFIA
jgi:hypothetical protein